VDGDDAQDPDDLTIWNRPVLESGETSSIIGSERTLFVRAVNEDFID
jgi:hypothetical protein